MQLHDYQKRLVNFLWTHPTAIIAVDMGLGKTAACCVWLDFLLKRGKGRHGSPLRGVIVAPKRVAEHVWLQEAQQWAPDVAGLMTNVKGGQKKRLEALKDDSKPIKVVSRDNLADLKKTGNLTGWDFLLIDELTSFKSPSSARSKIVTEIQADRKVGLTGTFLANGSIDIFGQAAAVGRRINSMNFYAWRATYFRDVMAGSGQPFSKWKLRGTLADVLAPLRDITFTLAAEDWLKIPEVTQQVHSVTLSADKRREYERLQAFLQCRVGDEGVAVGERQKFAKLQQLCNGFMYVDEEEGRRAVRDDSSDKLRAVADFVSVMAERGEQVLLFYSFIEEKQWLTEMLTAEGLRVTDVADRHFLDDWNEHRCDVLTAHPASAGHGLNLQHGGRIIVWSSLTYNFELFAQANARLARQGQTRQTLIHIFVADNTVEEQMARALTRKRGEQMMFKAITKI